MNCRNHHRNLPVGITRRVCCKRTVRLNHRNVLGISQLFGVFSVRALGLDADLTPSTERTMCGFKGLTLLFRGLVKLWWQFLP